MISQKVASLLSRSSSSTLPTIHYQRFFATDKNASLSSEKQKDLHEPEPTTTKVESGKNEADIPQLQRSLHSQYKERIQSSRVGRSADATTGTKPTASQKYFLVITRLFKSSSDIPEYVPHQTMKRMHDRMRVVTSVTAVVLVFLIAYNFEFRAGRKIDIDKASGKVVKTYADIK
uniref:Uncharacterized protein n=1 Tax=Panagrolaimus superbus TaxID=310955 RepID=A0A914Z3X3_9BILA